MDLLLRLSEPWAYLLVAAVAAGEASAFIGLFLPGEAAVILGGVLVFQGRADLGYMLAAACIGAVVGDSIGYEIGRHFGERLEGSRLGRRIGHRRWERAHAYVRRRGGKAVFLGRFVGVLRALVPYVAGRAGIPYSTFLVYNVAGGVLWATGFVFLGVVAGGSWRVVERWAGRSSLVLAGIVVVGILITLAARWVRDHRDRLERLAGSFLGLSLVVRVRSRYQRQIAFLVERFDPSSRAGLYLTMGLAAAIAAAWAFGAILEDVLARNELALFDRPIVVFLARHRQWAVTDVMKAVTLLGSTLVVTSVLASAAAFSYIKTRDRRWPAFLAATVAGAIAMDDVVKFLVNRRRPDFHSLVPHPFGSSFPSGHSVAAAALCGSLAYVVSRGRSWRSAVWIWAAAAFIALLVGFSRVYLGAHWPTDVLAGLALGAFWTAVAAVATRLLQP
jgi:membrane protein DedA with SNARE-associated domain/membrane-associated phospholipid phosphatase